MNWLTSVPEGWRWATLGQLAEVSKSAIEPRPKDALPYVGLENIVSGAMTVSEYGDASTLRSTKTQFESGDILYGKLRPYLDKVVLADRRGICSTDILVMRPRPDVDAYFLTASLHTRRFLQHAVSTTAGVTLPRTSWSSLQTHELAVPPLAEQRAIAKILRTVQHSMEATDHLIAAADELDRSLRNQLFTCGLRVSPVAEGQRSTDASPYPVHWSRVTLGSVCSVEWGNTALTKAAYSMGTVVAFSASGPDGFVDHAEHSGPGIVVSAIGARCGRCFWAEGDWTAIKNTIVLKALDPDRTDLRYIYHYVNQPAFWPRSGSGQPFIGIGQAAQAVLPLPPIAEQRAIADALGAVHRKANQEAASRDALATLFRSLVEGLTSAAIRVPRANGEAS